MDHWFPMVCLSDFKIWWSAMMMLTRSWCRRTSWSLPKTFFEPWPKPTRICITATTIPQDISVKLTTSGSHKLHLHRWLERSFRPWYVWTSPSSRANWAGQNLSPPTYSSWSVTRILFFSANGYITQTQWSNPHKLMPRLACSQLHLAESQANTTRPKLTIWFKIM